MAKDVITRFKLESTQYDSKIKTASRELADVAKTARSAGKDFDRFTSKNMEAAKALGSIATSSTDAKGRAKELVGAFNDVARAYNALTREQQQSDFGRAMSDSLTQLQQRIRDTKQEMQGLDSGAGGATGKLGNLFGGGKLEGMLQVLGGNLMTKGVMMVTNFANEMKDMVQQSIVLAKQGEGVRVAFERLGRGDILQGLREATHGTVTDLDLMKAAVKFDDFRLPLEELGTMLAFAQQKAKDTGQSVDYMVDSIVTGLGRESLLILDNLGLSAAEIKEKMKETGDMTSAVGAIIRKQMQKAGDYTETAADRAKKAEVEVQNAMETLGRTLEPLSGAYSSFWNDMKVGALNFLNSALKPIVADLIKMKALKGDYYSMSGAGDKVTQQINRLKGSSHKITLFNQMKGNYDKEINDRKAAINAYNNWLKDPKRTYAQLYKTAAGKYFTGGMFLKNHVQEKLDLLRQQRADLIDRGKKVLFPKKPKATPQAETEDNTDKNTDKNTTPKTTPTTPTTPLQDAQKKISDLTAEALTADTARLEVIKKEVEALQKQVDRYKLIQEYVQGKQGNGPVDLFKLNNKVTIPEKLSNIPLTPLSPLEKFANQETSTSNVAAFVSDIKSQLDTAPVGSALFDSLTAQLKDATRMQDVIKMAIEGGVKGADLSTAADSLKDALFEGSIDDDTLQSIIDQLNEKIGENELKIRLTAEGTLTTMGVENAEQAKAMAKEWNNAGQAIQAVGSAMQQLEDPAAKVMGTVAQAIATIALTFAQSLKGTFTPWDWIAAAAAGTATMISTISAIHSATGYADGGIVGGNSYSGDNLRTSDYGINAGELVLNRAQQGNLAAQLESSREANGYAQPYVSGEMLFLAMNNYSRRIGRGEIVTSRR